MKLFVLESKRAYDIKGKVKASVDPIVGYVIHGANGAIIIPKDNTKQHEIQNYVKLLEALTPKYESGIDFKMMRLDIRDVYFGMEGSYLALSALDTLLRSLLPRFRENGRIFITGENFHDIFSDGYNIIWSIYKCARLLYAHFPFRGVPVIEYLNEIGVITEKYVEQVKEALQYYPVIYTCPYCYYMKIHENKETKGT